MKKCDIRTVQEALNCRPYNKGNKSQYCFGRNYFFKLWLFNRINNYNAPAHKLLVNKKFWNKINDVKGLYIPKLICISQNFQLKNTRGTLYVFEKLKFTKLDVLNLPQLILLGEFLSVMEEFNFIFYDFHFDNVFSNLARDRNNKLIVLDIDSSIPDDTRYEDFSKFYTNATFFHLFIKYTKFDNMKNFNSLVYTQIILTTLHSIKVTGSFKRSMKIVSDIINKGQWLEIYNYDNTMDLGVSLLTMLNRKYQNRTSVILTALNTFINSTKGRFYVKESRRGKKHVNLPKRRRVKRKENTNKVGLKHRKWKINYWIILVILIIAGVLLYILWL